MKKIVWLALALAVLIGCAGKRPVQVATAAQDSLSLAQDVEAQLCWDVPDALHGPADKTHCTSATAAQIKLTDALHQQINAKLASAFNLHKQVVAQLDAGKTPDYLALNAAIIDVLALVGQLQQTPKVVQMKSLVQQGGGK